MSQGALSAFLTQAARAVAHSNETDAQLLDRYTTSRDEAAFAELVRRHGPFVLAVCRRTVYDNHLAEDAFQATFLVLARRAADVRSREGVRPFLYGVAVRVAREARVMAARRGARETPVATVPDRPTEPIVLPDAEALRRLDEEVAALPDKLRAAVVLCELDGLSRKEAATRLGIAEGTLSSRLAKARRHLATRLGKRGVTIPAVGLGVLASSTPVSARLFEATAMLAFPGAVVPAAVLELTKGVVRMLFVQKLRVLVAFALITVATMCAVVVAFPAPGPRREPATVSGVVTRVRPGSVPTGLREAPRVVPKGANHLLLGHGEMLSLVDPSGKADKGMPIGPKERSPEVVCARLSPDGCAIALVTEMADGTGSDAKRTRQTLHVGKAGADWTGPGEDLGVQCQWFAWSPDGTEIVCNEFDAEGKTLEGRHSIVNVKTKSKTTLKLPGNHLITDWSRDGKHFLTTAFTGKPEQPLARLYLMSRNGKEVRALTDESQVATFGRLSPDGTQVLYASQPLDKPAGGKAVEPKQVICVLTLASGMSVKIQEMERITNVHSFCWSPDGKKVAFTNFIIPRGKPGEPVSLDLETQVIVCDPDGKNPRPLVSARSKGIGRALTVVDWR